MPLVLSKGGLLLLQEHRLLSWQLRQGVSTLGVCRVHGKIHQDVSEVVVSVVYDYNDVDDVGF